MAKKIIGVYETPQETVAAIEGLTSKGYNSDNIAVITNRNDTNYVENRTGADVAHAGTANEPDSFWDKLKEFFVMDDTAANRFQGVDVPEGELDAYMTDLDEGKYLLAVDTAAQASDIDQIGNDTTGASGLYGGRSGLDERGSTPLTGVSGTAGEADTSVGDYGVTETRAGNPLESDNANLDTVEENSMKLREEVLDVDKDQVKTGEVRVEKEVTTEEKNIDVPVSRDEVYVERRPVNEEDGTTEPVDGNETIKVPIVEEQVEVTKKPVVTEEVVIGKRKVQDTEHISETLKKEDAHVDEENDKELFRESDRETSSSMNRR
ncbi:YsnF/AvaK domain-containing protein [Bacillus massiliglaciei]|uniref:YsnF/AvaK domain-containing protein n=1 Tax=Bacillus massiliglaciei TaxID=1816693 RepID=UPI000AEFDBBA|nr:YsnF/AvaK domain-containing protein [Bacillus massiliglaciei]